MLLSFYDLKYLSRGNSKSGKAKVVRFSTLEAICKALDCQPADILEYVED